MRLTGQSNSVTNTLLCRYWPIGNDLLHNVRDHPTLPLLLIHLPWAVVVFGFVLFCSCLLSCAGLVIERLRVQIPAGAAGEFYFPESTLCADFYSVSVPPPCYRSGT